MHAAAQRFINWLVSLGVTVALGCCLGAILGIAGMAIWAQNVLGSYAAETPFLARNATYGALVGVVAVYFMRHDPRGVLMPIAYTFNVIFEVIRYTFVLVVCLVINGGIAIWIYSGNGGAYNLFNPQQFSDWLITAVFAFFALCAVGGTFIFFVQIIDLIKGEPSRKLPKPRGGGRKFAPEGE